MKTKHGFSFGFAITVMVAIFTIMACVIENNPPETTYTVGGTGPAGGLVFYYKAEGFEVDGLTGTFHYLEASPTDVEYNGNTVPEWGGFGIVCGTTDDTTIGKGYVNTRTLQAHNHGTLERGVGTHDAAKAAWNYSVIKDGNTYEDWWLPSWDEITELGHVYTDFLSDKTGWGNKYWSSSENNAMNVFEWYFHNNDGGTEEKWLGGNYSVRAVRAF
jgi:hypothetical protein